MAMTELKSKEHEIFVFKQLQLALVPHPVVFHEGDTSAKSVLNPTDYLIYAKAKVVLINRLLQYRDYKFTAIEEAQLIQNRCQYGFDIQKLRQEISFSARRKWRYQMKLGQLNVLGCHWKEPIKILELIHPKEFEDLNISFNNTGDDHGKT